MIDRSFHQLNHQSDVTKSVEAYSQAGNPIFETIMAQRTASKEGSFFLRHLKPDMRVLDVGCASGSITIGFAEAAYNGEVLGIDFQPALIAQARALSAERGLTRTKFEVGSAYQLPFPDESIDAVFSNALLWHLSEPARVLGEMHRVLRPGGVIGIRECDWGERLHLPMTAVLENWYTITVKVRQHNGGDPFMGRHNALLLRNAGFVEIEVSESVWKAETPEEVENCAVFLKAQLQGFAKTALAQKWMDQLKVDEVIAEFDAWAKKPAAFYSDKYLEAIARKVV